MSTFSLLSMDAGQTGTKVRLHSVDGSTRDDLLPGVYTDRPLAPQLAQFLERLINQKGATPQTIAIGLSGVTDVKTEAQVLLHTPALAGVQRLILAHDSVTSYLSVLGDQQGAVIAVGTGVVTLGVGPHRAIRVDGWGNIMGDAGSGYWIGRETLDAVMRAYDSRGPATALTEIVRQQWADLETAYTDLQANPDRVQIVASFASHTATLAAEGDGVAKAICQGAAGELAHSIVSALTATKAPQNAAVGAIGGVLRSEVIRQAFETKVLAARPEAQFMPPVGTGLDGVDTLAKLRMDHPLTLRVADILCPASEATA